MKTDWRNEAACTSEDPELFFPVGEDGPAKTVCRECPVRAECLRWALDHGEDYGVWGGMSADERRMLRLWEISHARHVA
jgi:WhiB family redox-sensing transcriptional regulator